MYSHLKKLIYKHSYLSYPLSLLLSLFFINYMLSNYYPTPIDSNNARYLLSTLAQGQAAIIGIVVSLTLVAMQISAQTYSPRVIDIFKEYIGFWVLIAIYGLSIFFDVFALYVVPDNDSTVNLAILIAFVAFTALIPFIYYTMDLMKPKNIIEKLGNKIKKDDFLKVVIEKYVENNTQYSKMSLVNDEDQIVPLVDLIKKAIKSDDITATRDGINKLETILCELYDYEGNKDGITKHFCEHLERISSLSFAENNEDIIIELSETLERVADKALQKKDISQNAISYIALLLTEISEESSNRLWKKASISSLNSIGTIYIKAIEYEVLFKIKVDYVIKESFERIISSSLKKDLYFVINYFPPALKKICNKAIYEIPSQSPDTIKILTNINSTLIGTFREIGKKSLEYEIESVAPILTNNMISNFTEIGASMADIEEKVSIPVNSPSSFIKKLILGFDWKLDKNEKFVKSGLIYPIGNLGLSYSGLSSRELKDNYEQNMIIKCKWIIGFLKDAGNFLRGKSESSLKQVGSFVISIGNNCIINNSLLTATYAARTLRELNIDDLMKIELSENTEFKKHYDEHGKRLEG